MNDAKVFLSSSESVYYSQFVYTLIKKFDDPRLEGCHAAMGVAGEAGELCDAIKRDAIYGKPADIPNIIEELGDLEFYMENVRHLYGITRQQTLQANVAKLEKRYKDLVYTDAAAIARADKVNLEVQTKVIVDPAELPVDVAEDNLKGLSPEYLEASKANREKLEKSLDQLKGDGSFLFAHPIPVQGSN